MQNFNQNPNNNPTSQSTLQLESKQVGNPQNRWYVDSTSEMRVNIVNETLRDLGWYFAVTNDFFDDVVSFDYCGIIVNAYYHPDNAYRWFCAYVQGVEVCSCDFRWLSPDTVTEFCSNFTRQVESIAHELYKASLLG